MLLYALTVFLSAFLLFQVQPMIAKIILPWFGGGAAVWSTCLMFFQITLLLGYLYSHLVIRFLNARQQAVLHTVLLVLAALVPIHPESTWKPADERDPLVRILQLLAGTVGLGYLMLATTGPLLQAWYSRATGGAAPYRLYALSNAGSFLALLTFPFVVEPLLSSHQQTALWRSGFVVFVVLASLAGWRPALNSARQTRIGQNQETDSVVPFHEEHSPSLSTLALWILLAFCPSVMLSSISSHLTLNVAPMPFLWVLPLGIYLLTFVLCFDSDRFYQRGGVLLLLLIGLGTASYLLTEEHWDGFWPTYLWSGILFVGCLFCHGELAARKPHPRHLTIFFLMVSLGGALGGLFVGFVAPMAFNHYWELPISLFLCAVLALIAIGRDEMTLFPHSAPLIAFALAAGGAFIAATTDTEGRIVFAISAPLLLFLAAAATAWECRIEYLGRRYSRYLYMGVAAAAQFDYLATGRTLDWAHYSPYILMAAAGILVNWRIGIAAESRIGVLAFGFMAALLGGHLLYHQLDAVRGYRAIARNFYGVLKVRDYRQGEETTANRTLIHGSINHGVQLLDAGRENEPTSYYTRNSGFGRAIRLLQRNSPHVRVGITGLGAGVTAAYCRPGDYFRFYELNPLVLQINLDQFTFYKNCSADKDVYLGDGRLALERQKDQQFDLLAMDAFSSDSVPVHLLTREAFELYTHHISASGVLAINVSNRYLNLVPIVARNARDCGLTAMLITDDGEEKDFHASTSWMLCARRKEFFDDELIREHGGVESPVADAKLRPWTDSYSNLFQILKSAPK